MEKAFVSIARLALLRRIPVHILYYRLTKALAQFLIRSPWPSIPSSGKLIIVADALMVHSEKKLVSIYFIIVKRPEDSIATILPPYFGAARENDTDWLRAFAAMPEDVRARVFCLVADGKRGLRLTAKRYGWLLQRCHFHALGSFERRLSARGRARKEGQVLHQAVLTTLRTKHENDVLLAIGQLTRLSLTVTSKMLRQMIREFIKNHKHFRTYLQFPQYHIPITTGSLESLNSLLRDMLRRARGLRTHRSLVAWVEGFVKYKKTITCNGSNFQPN